MVLSGVKDVVVGTSQRTSALLDRGSSGSSLGFAAVGNLRAELRSGFNSCAAARNGGGGFAGPSGPYAATVIAVSLGDFGDASFDLCGQGVPVLLPIFIDDGDLALRYRLAISTG